MNFPPEIETAAVPPYSRVHSGTCLVVGTAWTMMDDFDRAMRLRPASLVMGINRSGRFLKCDFMTA